MTILTVFLALLSLAFTWTQVKRSILHASDHDCSFGNKCVLFLANLSAICKIYFIYTKFKT